MVTTDTCELGARFFNSKWYHAQLALPVVLSTQTSSSDRMQLHRVASYIVTLISLFGLCTSQFIGSSLYQPASSAQRIEIIDISSEANLTTLMKKKAFRSEIILFVFTTTGTWIDWAVAMHYQLASIGYQHHIAIAATTVDCERLHEVAPFVACGTYTLPGKHWELEKGDIDYLWISRYKLTNDIVRRTNISVLVIDLDCFFQRDVYADLHSLPHTLAKLIHMEEGPANGGVFYVRNSAARHGPALWVHDEVWRRADIIKRMVHSPGGFSGTAMDQAMCNDALNAAASSNGSVYDWPSTYVTGPDHHNHSFWAEHNRGNISRRASGARWYASDWTFQEVNVTIAVPPNLTDDQKKRFENFVQTYAQTKFKSMQLRIPADDEQPGSDKAITEVFAAALPLTLSNYPMAMHGWPVSAMVHLVGASADFGDGGDVTHTGRRALMAVNNAWNVKPTGKDTPLTYVALSQHTIESMRFDSKDAVLQGLRALFFLAQTLNRTPAVFGIPCHKLPWVANNSLSRDGVYDRRFVVRNGMCYPAPGGRDCWSFVYTFEISTHALPLLSYVHAIGLNHPNFISVRTLPEERRTIKTCDHW